MQGDRDIPAWLVCEDIFNKIKTELITQAMETLQDAIDSRAIEVNGSLVTLPDKPSDTDMKMFIINRIMEDKDGIAERYREYLSEKGTSDPKKVQQVERLKKFLLAIEQISMLMSYSKLFDEWMHDIAMQVTAKEPQDAITATLKGNETRMEVLAYVLGNAKIGSEEILTESERSILEKSIR
ncbi:MAG: hypothetical protein KGI06_01400 [Candidatus Micrarchaeota archaeon]|nr:hypothetical protein [Candidatus Micrarchaeota archaeon]